MKNLFILFVFAIGFSHVRAQKPSLKLDTYLTWPNVTSHRLSGDGKHAFYTILNEPIGKSTFVLVQTEGNRSIEVQGLNGERFSPLDQFVFGQLPNDTLVRIDLRTYVVEKLPNVKSYQGFEYNGKEWCAILRNDVGNTLVLSATGSKKTIQIKDIQSYIIGPNNKFLIIVDGLDHKTKYYDLASENSVPIFDGNATNLIFSPDCKKIAFMVKSSNGNQIWEYTKGSKARLILENDILKLNDKSLRIDNSDLWRFSKDGKLLFFSLNKTLVKNIDSNLTVWSYQDAYLKSDARGLHKSAVESRSYAGYINLSTMEVKQLTNGNQKIMSFPQKNDSLFLVEESHGGIEESKFIDSARISYYLGFTQSGKLLSLKQKSLYNLQALSLSPYGKFVIYYDMDSSAYFSYNILSKKILNLTRSLKANFLRIDFEGRPISRQPPVGIDGWSEHDNDLFINSSKDIWRFDPEGNTKPVNLTSRIDEKMNIVYYPLFPPNNDVIVKDHKILLTGFNLLSKEEGFYELILEKETKLIKLSSQSISSGDRKGIYVSPPVHKADKSNNYLIWYSKVNQYPNIYFSKDFEDFKPISHLAPHKQFNWMTKDLHQFSDKSGHQLFGILCKPEDFDSTKKYPVVINFYTKMSNELNKFESPELNGGDITVAQLVSNGYIVFKIDIYPEMGNSGGAALNSVLAAADHLSTYGFIDSKKMAIAGHSFGGFETNFIVTHTSRFAAAISAAGISNMTDQYNSIWGGGLGMSHQSYISTGPPLMGENLAHDPDTYIKNSPVFSANQMNTPLLLMHNEEDANVPFVQGLQFFIQLRSVRKPVWMLSYKGERHVIADDQNKIDYYRKINEFLGYYLKGESMPKWMKDHN